MGKDRERTRRLVPHTGSASREHERTRALRDAIALIHVAAEGRRRIPETDGKHPSQWTPNGPGVRQSSAALPGNETQMNTTFGPARGPRVESARGLAHSGTLSRSSTMGWKVPQGGRLRIALEAYRTGAAATGGRPLVRRIRSIRIRSASFRCTSAATPDSSGSSASGSSKGVAAAA